MYHAASCRISGWHCHGLDTLIGHPCVSTDNLIARPGCVLSQSWKTVVTVLHTAAFMASTAAPGAFSPSLLLATTLCPRPRRTLDRRPAFLVPTTMNLDIELAVSAKQLIAGSVFSARAKRVSAHFGVW
jgi:hypothetical protein